MKQALGRICSFERFEDAKSGPPVFADWIESGWMPGIAAGFCPLEGGMP